MGGVLGRIRAVTTGSEPNSRSRLLLDQRTPAEREISEEDKHKRRKTWGIICGTVLFLVIVAAIVFYIFLYADLLPDDKYDHDEWSLNKIILRPGFKIEEYATLNSINWQPRSLHVSEYAGATIVYVGSNTPYVYALVDRDSDGTNDDILAIWESSFAAYSITVNEDQQTIYIDDMTGNIWHCPNVHQQVLAFTSQQQRLQGCEIWVHVPLAGQLHNTHYMSIIRKKGQPDGDLCMAFGVTGNIALPQDSVEGTIRCFNGYDVQSINDSTVYARGIRNSVGFEFHPTAAEQQLWFTDCGPVGLSADLPDDELNKVTAIGQHFGFPYCFTQGFGDVEQRTVGLSENLPDETLGINNTCDKDEYSPAYQPMGPHVQSLGMKFIFSESFKLPFILIAQHGSNDYRNPDKKIGYRIMMAELFGGGFEVIPPDGYKIFAKGWLDEETQQVYGTPVDVEWLRHDDSFIVSDDYRNVIYRIYYEAEAAAEE